MSQDRYNTSITSSRKDAKRMLSWAVLEKAVGEADDILGGLAARLSAPENAEDEHLLDLFEEVENAQGRIMGFLHDVKTSAPAVLLNTYGTENPDGILDDDLNPDLCKDMIKDIKTINNNRFILEHVHGRPENPDGELVASVEEEAEPMPVEAGIIDDSIRDTIKYLRTNKERLKQLFEKKTIDPAVEARQLGLLQKELQEKTQAGKVKPNALAEVSKQWLDGSLSDADLTAKVEGIMQRKSSLQKQAEEDLAPETDVALHDFAGSISKAWSEEFDETNPDHAAVGEVAWKDQIAKAHAALVHHFEAAIEVIHEQLAQGDFYSGPAPAEVEPAAEPAAAPQASARTAASKKSDNVITSRDVRRAIKFIRDYVPAMKEFYFNYQKVVAGVTKAKPVTVASDAIHNAISKLNEVQDGVLAELLDELTLEEDELLAEAKGPAKQSSQEKTAFGNNEVFDTDQTCVVDGLGKVKIVYDLGIDTPATITAGIMLAIDIPDNPNPLWINLDGNQFSAYKEFTEEEMEEIGITSVRGLAWDDIYELLNVGEMLEKAPTSMTLEQVTELADLHGFDLSALVSPSLGLEASARKSAEEPKPFEVHYHKNGAPDAAKHKGFDSKDDAVAFVKELRTDPNKCGHIELYGEDLEIYWDYLPEFGHWEVARHQGHERSHKSSLIQRRKRADEGVGAPATIVQTEELALEPADPIQHSDTAERGIDFVNDNASSFADANVADVIQALTEAGYSREVASEVVREVFGPDAELALGTPVAVLLG